nr:unnamed protein product [Callosobruchus chinensis]
MLRQRLQYCENHSSRTMPLQVPVVLQSGM